MALFKSQRIRDPVHNLIEFGEHRDWSYELETVLWDVIKTQPFQRLRRVRQLGFSEYVYPGATHSRFAHSLGVFHTARQLMAVIRRQMKRKDEVFHESKARAALAAALLHDVGHGMFSHAFEDVGKRLNLKMAHHEHVSDQLIRSGEIGEVLCDRMGSGFADDVATIISAKGLGNIYNAVVSSQFDADRLDYMQRDRLMAGVHNSAIDFRWLMANLEIGQVPIGTDEQEVGMIDTFVLGPKALHAAETYVLSLFQLYPTIYFHKTTRAAEKLFSELLLRFFELVRAGKIDETGLPLKHPLVQFAQDPEKIGHALALDDTVFFGALPMLITSDDALIQNFAARLWKRQFPKCIDVLEGLKAHIRPDHALDTEAQRKEYRKKLDRAMISIEEKLTDWSSNNSQKIPRVLIDKAKRSCYKSFKDSGSALNQIRIRMIEGDKIFDIAEISNTIAAIEPFSLFRAYFFAEDTGAEKMIRATINEAVKGGGDDNR